MSETARSEGKFVPAFFVPVVERGDQMQDCWPLHITLFPPVLEPYNEAYGEALRELVNPLPPFDVIVGGRAYFGPEHDIPVQRIKPSRRLHELHQAIVATVGTLLHDPTYRQPYNPHITVRGAEDMKVIRPESSIEIGGLSIVTKNRGETSWVVRDKIGLRG